jgi:hypothetical protein
MSAKVSKNRESFRKGLELPLDEPVKDLSELKGMNIDSSDSIEDMFRNEQTANQNDIKELFHEDRVKARTDISQRQVKLITKAFYLAEITGMKEIHSILKDFLVLSISKDRKSRLEYVEGLKAKIDNSLQQSAMQMRGQFAK